nr:CPBP family intramembrane glutamic endopeptidase [uncultured Lachnoanaerobaculum sp.]
MKKFFYTFGICFYPILIYTAVQSSLGMFLAVVFGLFEGARDFYAMMDVLKENALVITAICAVVASVVLSLFFHIDIKNGRIERRGQIKAMDFIMAIVGGAGVSIALNIVIALTNMAGKDTAFVEVSDLITSNPLIVTIICAGILIPIVEEILFRGLIFNRIKHQYNFLAGLLISSLLFGIYHGNIVQGIYATLLGIFLGFAYHKTKSILIPVFIHMGGNTFVSIYAKLGENEENIGILVVTVAISIIFALIGTIYFINRKVEQ